MKQLPWAQMSCEDVLKHLKVSMDAGLGDKEAEQRLAIYGPNTLAEERHVSPLVLFLNQFRDFMVLVLLAATLLSGLLGEYSDALTIIVIVLVNAILGFVQEYRAERSLEALRGLTAPTAKVLRDKRKQTIPADDLVPGDVIFLEAGDRVPADIRICDARHLSVNEAPLTGESEPVEKTAEALACDPGTPGERYNMLFMGTMVVGGRGSGVVVATGMETEMGRVAHLIQTAQNEETPLQRRLAQMGRYLVASCLLVCACVVLLGLSQGLPVYNMLMAGVSLAVAAIPEGLPAVVTIALAIGVQRMVKRNAIVRKLPAVETLGCATVICSDKTGTLTQNKMNVQYAWAGDQLYEVKGEGYSPQGGFFLEKRQVRPAQDPDLLLLLKLGVLCNNAVLKKGEAMVKGLWRGGRAQWDVDGNPTEGALVVAAARAGLWREDLERQMTRIGEIPFDSTRKMMTVIYRGDDGLLACVKGAPEEVLARCTKIFYRGKVNVLTGEMRKRILLHVETMAAQACRNLAVAYRLLPAASETPALVERDLIFSGIFSMMDPPRPEVFAAIRKCQSAGIRTVMITGDHKSTAVAVARMLDIIPPGGKVLTGKELDELTDDQLEKLADSTYVFARVTPEHKLRIVRSFKKAGHVVAMTGDGINDAPALKEADIGIAMGRSGTDVTREAAALVLADDNFATIVNAVEEGRSIYDNIRKFIRFLLGCNTGEILTMFLAMVLGLPLPLKAIQILWINLVTDGLPAMALGVDPADSDVMKRPPRLPSEGVFARGLWQKIVGRGTLIGTGTVAVFAWALNFGIELEEARTLAFITLIMMQLVYVFSCRSEVKGAFAAGLLANPFLVPAVGSSFLLMLLVIYHPPLAAVFGTVAPPPEHWLIVICATLLPGALEALWQALSWVLRQAKIAGRRA